MQLNTTARIQGLQQEITGLSTTIGEQKNTIDKLQNELATIGANLDTVTQEKGSMTFLGARMAKSKFQTIVWSFAGILLLGLLWFIFKYKNSNSITRDMRRKLNEVEREFEDFRKRALEKEQKMGRLLQDERNKSVKASKG